MRIYLESMNIIQKIKLCFKIKKEVKRIREGAMKSGWKTTEFWLTIIGSGVAIFSAVGGLIPADLSAKIIAGAVMVYTIARAIVKFTSSRKDDELLDKVEQIISKQKNS